MAAEGWHIYYGRGDEVIPPDVTRVRIDESLTVIPAQAFYKNRNIKEVECHVGVKQVEAKSFYNCISLRRVIMPGVKVVQTQAFNFCVDLAIVECGKLERIGRNAFYGCESLRSIDLPSAKIVESFAFYYCTALINVEFGKELESIGRVTLHCCTSLERITIPLKDGMITDDNIFQECYNLKHVDLVEGEVLRDTVAALLLDEWRNDMDREIDAINQSLLTASAGAHDDAGEKAQAIRMWISSVLHKIVQYKAQHRRLLNEAASTLQSHLPNDIVINYVLPFLELPSYTFEGGG